MGGRERERERRERERGGEMIKGELHVHVCMNIQCLS